MRSPCRTLILGLSVSTLASCGSQPPTADGREVAAGTTSRIPLVAGLTIVTAVHDPERGDYESLKRVVSIDDRGYAVAYSADVPPGSGLMGGILGGLAGERGRNRNEPRQAEQVRSRRTVLERDRLAAREYLQYFGSGLPDAVPGTTALGVSRDVLLELRTNGATTLTMRNVDPFGRIGTAISGLLRGMAGELAPVVDSARLEDIDRISGTLERISGNEPSFHLTLNGRPAVVAALAARGTLGDQPVELLLLDDAENPIALSWKIGEQYDLRVVRIHVPDAGSPDEPEGVERQLADAGRATVYGIYFDFNSDTIKPESDPVLREIATALSRHPDWKLAVEGHTDAIGDTRSNIGLSERRAAAVKTALVDRHRISAGRLTTSGVGESRPRAPNDTLEGRAQNRRVELVRQRPAP